MIFFPTLCVKKARTEFYLIMSQTAFGVAQKYSFFQLMLKYENIPSKILTLERSIFCLFSITHACQHFKSELALHVLGIIKTNFQLFLPQEQVCGV